LTKKEHINYWLELALEDFETAVFNISGKRYVPALFFYHLSIEKILKANWVKDNISNTPPFTHDLQKIAGETEIEWDAANFDYLSIVNTWNIEARYPDYKNTLQKIATVEYMNKHHEKLKILLHWLEQKL
jgi:HEPN domain-containing protein